MLRVHSGCFSTSSASLDKEKTVSLAELPSASFTKGTHRLVGPFPHAVDYLPITTIWKECLQRYGGPYLFGATPTTADAMYAPVCTRFATYDVKLDPVSAAYRDQMLRFPAMLEWANAARSEPEEVEELDVEF